jgi:hypothetical protein
MIDLTVGVLPNGDRVSLVVKGAQLPHEGQRFDRDLFSVSPQELDELRRGAPTEVVVEGVSDSVSKWLLSLDLKQLLAGVLSNAGDDRVRLAFGVDPSLPTLADVPLELLRVDEQDGPLVLDQRVSAIIHVLPKVPSPRPGPTTPTERLRVLIVRSNPDDFGGAVPPAAPLRDAIAELGATLGPNRVQIDVISNEPGIEQPATWDAFRDQLDKGYDLLVYLGHGDLDRVLPGGNVLGVLHFETPEGPHEPVGAIQLKYALEKRPVPVVLLVGCLTAANLSPKSLEFLTKGTPNRVRGLQGVAQQLVNSQSGVQIAVGMRYWLESEAAIDFLQEFFESLLKDEPGNIEAAVRAGRGELFVASPHPPSWSAPVVFRAPGPEPFFGFLAQQTVPEMDRVDERDQDLRRHSWEALVSQPLSARSHDSLKFAYQILDKAESDMRERALSRGALLMPGRIETGPGTSVDLSVMLDGVLNVETLEGWLVVGDESARVKAINAAPALQKAGYRVVSELPGGNRGFFRIERNRADATRPVPAGELLVVTLVLGANFPLVYPVCLESLASVPPRLVQTINNAAIVPAP